MTKKRGSLKSREYGAMSNFGWLMPIFLVGAHS